MSLPVNDPLHYAVEHNQSRDLNASNDDRTRTASLNQASLYNVSTDRQLITKVTEARALQDRVELRINGPPSPPQKGDFPGDVVFDTLRPYDIDEPLEHCVLLLHDRGSDKDSLKDLAFRLRMHMLQTVFVLLQARFRIAPDHSTWSWKCADTHNDTAIVDTSTFLLETIIRDGLMKQCRFEPEHILMIGHGEGGEIALASAAIWNNIEFGGIASIDGSLKTCARPEQDMKARTPALILKGSAGNLDGRNFQQIKRSFVYVDPDSLDEYGAMDLRQPDHLEPLFEFLAHRLQRDEWTKEAVISFDGGGIRGYGTLLILEDLMNKIGDEERRSNSDIKSSFSPCDYKPTVVMDMDQRIMVPTPTNGLQNSSLFLPCHYFTYAAGTSTGGLISILLQRFRMSVDDCLKEYEALGEQIFGHPRPLSLPGGPFWHKFDATVLERVIQEVTSRRCEIGDDNPATYAMEAINEDMCKCVVLAYSSIHGGDKPYLLRTYKSLDSQKPLDRAASKKAEVVSSPNTSKCMWPIYQVARATSAAPGYFRPITILRGNGPESITFKDGGFGANNPSHEAFKDIVKCNQGMDSSIGPFVSIGTGDKELKMFGRRKGNLHEFVRNAKSAMQLPTRTFKADETMRGEAVRNGVQQFPYFRFDGGELLGKIALDEWKSHRLTRITDKDPKPGQKTLEKIKKATAIYIQQRQVQEELLECAKILVRRRRLRTRNLSSWDRYASFSFYECVAKGCTGKQLNTIKEYRHHLSVAHHLARGDDPDGAIKARRRVHWLYRQGLDASGPQSAAQASKPTEFTQASSAPTQQEQ